MDTRGLVGIREKSKRQVGKLTEIGEHVDYIVVCDLAVIVSVQYLECFAHLPHLARGKLGEGVVAQGGLSEMRASGHKRGRACSRRGRILNGSARWRRSRFAARGEGSTGSTPVGGVGKRRGIGVCELGGRGQWGVRFCRGAERFGGRSRRCGRSKRGRR